MKGKTVVQRREGRNCQGVADTQRRPRGRQARGRAAAGFLAGSQGGEFPPVSLLELKGGTG